MKPTTNGKNTKTIFLLSARPSRLFWSNTEWSVKRWILLFPKAFLWVDTTSRTWIFSIDVMNSPFEGVLYAVGGYLLVYTLKNDPKLKTSVRLLDRIQ